MTIDVRELPLWLPNRSCESCGLRAGCAGPVPGVGPLSATIMFVGEGPGYREDESGFPFAGPAGAEFDRQLARIGVSRDDVWVTNVCKCRIAGGGRVRDQAPSPTQAKFCGDLWLDSEIRMIRPRLVVTMGVPATTYVTGTQLLMDETHGRIQRDHRYTGMGDITVISIYHPAAVLRDRGKLLIKVVERDFDQVKAVLDSTYVEASDEYAGKEQYAQISPSSASELLEASVGNPVALDTESKADSVSPLFVQISTTPGVGYVIPADEIRGHRLAQLIQNAHLVMHNAAYDLQMLWRLGIHPPIIDDTMVMAWMLQDLPVGLKLLARHLCGMEMMEYTEMVAEARKLEIIRRAEELTPTVNLTVAIRLRNLVAKSGARNANVVLRWRDINKSSGGALGPVPNVDLSYPSIAPSDAIRYAGRDPDATLRVYLRLWPRIQEMGLEQSYAVDIGAIPMIARMVNKGMPVNRRALVGLHTIFSMRMEQTAEECHKLAGILFNVGSDDQVAKVVFGGIKSTVTGKLIPSSAATKVKGRPKVDLESLEPLRHHHPIISAILRYKRYDTMLASFVNPLLRDVALGMDGITWRVHGNINPAGTETARYKHSEPNLAAQPVRYAEGRMVRSAFEAPPHMALLAFDYSQIEMRVMAVGSGDPNMIRVFRENRDIHAETAAAIWGVPLHVILDEHRTNPYGKRYIAKRGGFGTIYWISAHGFKDYLEQEAGGGFDDWDVQRCQQFLDDYFKLYPRVREYGMEKQAEARRYGYTRDMWGRTRLLPQVHSTNRWIRLEGEREAVNSGIQSGAMGIVKAGMGAMDRWTVDVGAYPWMYCPLMQIHDEVLGEANADPENIDWLVAMIKPSMESATPDHRPFPIPIVVDAKVGRRWGDMKPMSVG